MLIDWFTVIAQLLNFIVLMWLLKRFLYRPILGAIDAREKKIEQQIRNADEKVSEAEKEREIYQKKNNDLNQKFDELLSNAVKEASVKKNELIENARKDAADLKTRLLEGFENEKKEITSDIIQRTRDEVFSISRKVLKDLASSSLEEQMTETFLILLGNLDPKERTKLVSIQDRHEKNFLINSVFEIPESQRARIKKVLQQIISESNKTKDIQIDIEFKETPEQISGIEMITDGYKLAWSISDYLQTMQKHVSELFKDGLGTQTED